MEIYFSPYELTLRTSGKVQRGALVKVVRGGFWGVADLCPHLELGDASVADEVRSKGALFLRALELANDDLLARSEKRSLLHNKKVKNNILLTEFKNLNLNEPRFVGNTVKIKGTTDVASLAQVINACTSDVRLRLDFNSKLDIAGFENFLSLVSLERIEYIEDPTEFCAEWKKWNLTVPLAFDFQNGAYQKEFAKFCIVKTARKKLDEYLQNYTLTSAMDHPVGVAHGLRVAQEKSQNDAGFLTLDLYEDTGFNKYYEQTECWLNFSDLARRDVGIGMTSELEKLQWKSEDRMSF